MKAFLRNLQTHTIRKAKRITSQPARYGVLSRVFYPLVFTLARMQGVPPVFLDRATALREETESDLTAVIFLNLIRNLYGRKERMSLSYDLPALLQTDEERATLRKLMEARIEGARSPLFVASLKANLLRLDDAAVDEERVKALLQDTLSNIINQHLNQAVPSRDKYFVHDDARRALEEVDKIFKAAGKRFFLDRGTLLGAIREDGFIQGDYDIDLGVLESEITLPDVRKIMSGHGFGLIQSTPWKLAYQSGRGITVDFFLTRERDGMFISRGNGEVHQWTFKPFTLQQHNFGGQSYHVPSDAEGHLEQLYGNWQSPNLFYDLSFDEYCLTYVPKLNAALYLTQRFSTAMKTRNRFNAERCLRALAADFDVDLTDHLSNGRRFKQPERR